MESFFKLKQNGTSIQTEVLAGITSFLATMYIIVVNPGIAPAAVSIGAGSRGEKPLAIMGIIPYCWQRHGIPVNPLGVVYK